MAAHRPEENFEELAPLQAGINASIIIIIIDLFYKK